MRKLLTITMLSVGLTSCQEQGSNNLMKGENHFQSNQVEGKWTTDIETAQELKALRNTIENFTLLNRKKFENLKAYQEFGDLLQMHIDRSTTYCKLDKTTKSLLCQHLDKLKAEIQTLHGSDMEKSKQSIENINRILTEIDSTFSYTN